MTPPPFDATLALRRDPYRFLRRTCAALGTEAFETRLLLEPTLFLSGARAARFFYDREVFTREGAAPTFLKATLFGRGSVQGLDGDAHHRRKAMFLHLLGPGRTDALTDRALQGLDRLARQGGVVTLHDAAEAVLTAAVCDWAGLPLDPGEVPDRARMLARLFEHAVRIGPRHLLARLSRHRADRWSAAEIEAVRAGRSTPPPESAVAVVARWRDPDGRVLPPPVAAVELLNVLRPFVAISAYLTFAAHALATRPGERRALAGDAGRIPFFVQEVRRSAPFFPMLAARTRRAARWDGHALPAGRRVVLDIYGTNRDPQAWDEPDAFRPERFAGWAGDPFTLIPQGGGKHEKGHRCPGEWVTQDLMAAATGFLLDRVDWDRLPEQDLTLDMRALPALPRDRMRLRFRAGERDRP